MYVYNEPYSIKEIKGATAIAAVVDNQAIGNRKFMLVNAGAQPLYFKEKAVDNVDCTATNGMVVPANTVFPQVLTAQTLSLISNATGTSYAILFLDI